MLELILLAQLEDASMIEQSMQVDPLSVKVEQYDWAAYAHAPLDTKLQFLHSPLPLNLYAAHPANES